MGANAMTIDGGLGSPGRPDDIGPAGGIPRRARRIAGRLSAGVALCLLVAGLCVACADAPDSASKPPAPTSASDTGERIPSTPPSSAPSGAAAAEKRSAGPEVIARAPSAEPSSLAAPGTAVAPQETEPAQVGLTAEPAHPSSAGVTSAYPAPPAAGPTAETSAESGPAEPLAPAATQPPVTASGSGGARLRIPRIGVDAPIESVGLTGDGLMGVPKDAAAVAWYAPGSRWGGPGNAAITGHLDDTHGQPAVFWRLKELRPGDEIRVQDADGTSHVYEVNESRPFPVGEFPRMQVFGPTDAAHLNIYTCHGRFVRPSGYTERWIVFSTLKGGG